MAFYNRWDRLKRFAKLLYQDKQFVESAEFNESESIRDERERALGDMLVGPISLRSGGTVIVDSIARTVRITGANVWAGGYLHPVADRTLTNVAMTGTVAIGVAVTEVIVTPNDDPSLKGVVPNTESHGEPLANRLRYDAVWATSGNPFYPVFTLVDGIIINEVKTQASDSGELAVERHIRETHGSHVVEGFRVNSAGFDAVTNEQVFIISSGVLRAEGRRVSRAADQRFRHTENPSLVQVNGETHLYPSGGVIQLNNGPIADVGVVTSIKEKTVNLTHALAGGADNLPNSPVFEIRQVKQGSKIYISGSDYSRSGDAVSWSPPGDEPNPGTTYEVTFRYVDTVVPTAIGRETITIEPSVVGQPVTVQYRYKLNRIDVIAIDLEGQVVYLEGISSKYNTASPPVPEPLAPLARVENLWGIPPRISDFNQRKMTEAEVQAMLRTLLLLADQVSLTTLEKDIQERDPASRRGSFVDPFDNDLQRDFGIVQDAAIVGGFLMLPVEGFPRTIDIGRDPITLPYIREAIITQPFRTLSRKINAYMNFTPLPTPVSLNPAVDRWNENQSSSSSSSSSSFAQNFLYMPETVGTPLYGTSTFSTTTTSSTSSSSTTSDLPFLRSIEVEFTVRRMGPGEQLDRVTFDGIDVTASVTGTKVANAQGVMVAKFTIPPNVRAGTKTVTVRGKGGSNGETSFTGQGTLTITHYHTTTHTHTQQTTIDPVAQSFVLEEARQITGARVEFTGRGDPAKHVVLEMRDMEGGLPGPLTIAEGSTPGTFTIGDPNVVKPENWTEILFRFMTTVQPGEFRWIALLTDDPNHSVAIAQLGDQSGDNPRGFDPRLQQWVRANPALGDLADGSNGRSWRLLPESDLTHEIMAARYTALTRTFTIGTFKLSDIHPQGISDVLVLLVIEAPSPRTTVRIEMLRANGEIISFEPNVALSLREYLTEEVTVRMVLNGTSTLSPIVMPECQIVWGRLHENAIYVSEANDIDITTGPVKVRTVVETNTPGTSSVTLELGNPGSWDLQPPAASRPMGDNWVEREHLETPYNSPTARVKISLQGNPRDRPAVRKLRQRATEV